MVMQKFQGKNPLLSILTILIKIVTILQNKCARKFENDKRFCFYKIIDLVILILDAKERETFKDLLSFQQTTNWAR